MIGKDDIETLHAVKDRLAAGATKHREATRDEWLAVLLCALWYQSAFEALAADAIADHKRIEAGMSPG
jgi:hypothetical protein